MRRSADEPGPPSEAEQRNRRKATLIGLGLLLGAVSSLVVALGVPAWIVLVAFGLFAVWLLLEN